MLGGWIFRHCCRLGSWVSRHCACWEVGCAEHCCMLGGRVPKHSCMLRVEGNPWAIEGSKMGEFQVLLLSGDQDSPDTILNLDQGSPRIIACWVGCW